MKKRIAVLLCCTMLSALCLSGCGDTKKEDSPSGQNTDTQNPSDIVTPDTQTPQQPTEEPSEPEVSEAGLYDEVLAQYRNAIANDFYEDQMDDYDAWEALVGEYVAYEYVCNHMEPICYTLYDVNGDGIDELLLAVLYEDFPFYYDIFTHNGMQPVRLFDMNFGYRVNLNVFTDGTLEVTGSNGAAESFNDFYCIGSQGSPVITESFSQTGELLDDTLVTTYKNTVNGETTILTETEFYDKLSVYEDAARPELNWTFIQ